MSWNEFRLMILAIFPPHSGHASGGGSADLATARQAVNTAIASVDHADAQVGQQLQVSKEWAGLRARILQATQKQQPAATALDTYNKLLTDALMLVTNAGNNSNLILDPDLDSFYVMDEWITKLPPLMETIGRTSDLEATFAASAAIFASRRRSSAVTCAVTSRAVPRYPINRSDSSNTGLPLIDTICSGSPWNCRA